VFVPTVNVVVFALVITGEVPTWSVAVAVPPVPAAAVTLPVVFTAGPALMSVTGMVIVQLPLAAMVAPVMVMVPEPTELLVKVALAQVVVATVEMVMPDGNVSVTATLVCELLLEVFVRVSVIVEVPPTAIWVGENAFAIVGTERGFSARRSPPFRSAPLSVAAPVPVAPAVVFSAHAAPAVAPFAEFGLL